LRGYVGIALFAGILVYGWMVAAGLPRIIAAPMGLISFFVVLAALFKGIEDVISDAINAIRDLMDSIRP